jgi:CheY-like chemotaxis protein
MAKQVLDIGNCGPDHGSLTKMLRSRFDVDVHQAHQASDALDFLRSNPVDLILVNRKLDIDYSDGIDVIKTIKAEQRFGAIPTMLVTNYEEHQQAAMAVGAERGFGKLQFNEPSTQEALARFLA